MKNILFNKRFLKGIKIFSLISITLLVVCEIFNILFFTKDGKIEKIWVDIHNILSITLFSILFFNPQKTELLAVICFSYAVDNFLTYGETDCIGLFMYFLCFEILYTRGYFIKHKKIKIAFAIIFLTALISYKLHLGTKQFLSYMLKCFAYTLLFLLQFFFLTAVLQKKDAEKEKVLNLCDYLTLKKSDLILLELVQQNKLYKEIAVIVNKSEGTIRNRLNRIYHILDVIDRMGFISAYSNYKIIYEENTSANKKEDS